MAAHFTITIGADTREFTPPVNEVKKKVEEVKKEVESLAKTKLEELSKKFTDWAGKIKAVGEALSKVGKTLTDSLTTPIFKFTGLDKLSKEVNEKLGKLSERFKTVFSKLFEPVIPVVTKAIDWLIGMIDKLITWFDNAPAGVKVFVAVLAGIAMAIGPVIGAVGTALTAIAGFVTALAGIAASGTVGIVVGVIAAAIAGLVAGIGIAIGVVYALKQAWDNGFGPIASVVAIAVGLIMAALLPIVGLPVLIGAVAMTIYEMWATNFGGLQEFTAIVWAKVQEYVAIAMAAIKQLVDDIGGDIVAWWNENYPLIQQTVQTVSDAIRAYIQNFLNNVKAFWDLHGEQIMSVVKSIWSIISTIVRTGVNVILGVVRMVMQIINGDWAGAWNTALSIVQKINSAIWKILGELGNIVIKALAFVLTEIANWAIKVGQMAEKIGENIVNGIINGISALADTLKNYARNLITSLFGVMNNAAETRSPSQVTTRMGMFIGLGLVDGLNNAAPLVNAAAKKMVDSSLGNMGKEAQQAVKEFQAMAGSTAQQQQDIVTIAQFGQGKSNLDELIKLRAELNQNVNQALPNTLAGVNAELDELGKQKRGIKDAADMLAQFDAAKKKLVETGLANNMQIQGEINLLQAQIANNYKLSEAERQRIKDQTEVEKYKASLRKEGFNDGDIAALAAELELQQKQTEALRATLSAKQDLIAANETYNSAVAQMTSTLDALNVQLGLKKAATELDRLETLLQTDAYKNLNEEQIKNLRIMAEQIDQKRKDAAAQEEAKKKFGEFKDFIKESLNTLVNDGFGAMFKSIFNKFKKMLIDMAVEWITSKLYKLIFKDGQATGTGRGGGIGGILQSFLGLFGIGKKGSSSSAADGGGGGDAPKVGSFGGLFDPKPNILNGGKTSALAGKMSGIGALATLAGSIIGGRVGGIMSMAGTGMSIGAMFGPWGAAIGAGVGALVGLFMGDPKKKVDKKENMPKLQKGFTDAMQQLRDLMNDRNALFGDPEGAVAKAMEIRGAIASGFGIEFQSKKYKKEAAKLIATKLIEADQLIKQIKEMADMARAANSVNTRLEAEFATGVFADRAFIRQHADFKRRNGLLAGGWTGRDTLPSMLAAGEMVLNPKQIDRVRSNAGFDAFRGAGIPNYASGTFVGSGPVANAPTAAAQPVTVQIVLNNSGIVESDIKGVLVNGLKQPDVQVELVKAYDKGKTRARS